MLELTCVLGSSVIYLLIREGGSGTYRCPHCSQIQTGTYHKMRCAALNGQEVAMPLPSQLNPTPSATRSSKDTQGEGLLPYACA
jgi:hypothetical protein